jgi:two-component system response regulator HydG
MSEKADYIVGFTLPVDLEHAEIEIIKATIKYYEGDKKRAAIALGISLKTIYNKLEREEQRCKQKEAASSR